MERLIHETRETFTAMLVVTCLAAGVFGAVFYTFGPDGWLVAIVGELLLDPSMSAVVALAAVIAVLATAKHWLDKKPGSTINNLLVGAVAVGGFAVILQGIRFIIG